MGIRALAVAVLLSGLVAAAPVAAADVVLIPPAGWSEPQVGQDQTECRAIASQLTGFVPGAPPPSAGQATAAAAPPPATGGRVRGAAAGAAVGAVAAEARTPDLGGGELEDAYKEERVEDAAKAGAVVGASRQRQQRRQAASQQQAAQQQAAQQQAAAQTEAQKAFDLAATACLMGRGYHK